MEKYVQQLIEDLEKAMHNNPPNYDVCLHNPDDPALEHGLTGVAAFLNSPLYPLEEILGIQSAWFPPIEQLNDRQIDTILEKLYTLLEQFNYIPDFPENLPEKKQYLMLISQLKEETQYVSTGYITLEFCEYIPEECPFGIAYCQCK
jgi:hypothetical protein